MHLATPLSVNTSRYSTRRNSVGLVDFILDLEKVLRRRLNKLSSRKILVELGSESISDIHILFPENTNTTVSDIMGEYFTQLDFSQIVGQPHCLPYKAVKKLLIYTGTDAITSTMHLRNFSRCINAYVNDPVSQHDDVYMKLFALSLDGKAGDWYSNLPDSSFNSLAAFKTSFTNKFGENK